MGKDILHIVDTSFAHAPTSSWYNVSKKFNWIREGVDINTDNIVLTYLPDVDKFLYEKREIYGWLIEPPELNKFQYDYIKVNYHKFKKIFTYDKDLLDLSEKFVLLPIGGCWIDESDRAIYEKNKLLCTITSHKKMTAGHRLRHEAISTINKIDVFGYGYNPIKNKIDTLKDYMFNLVIENQKMDFLFTEKLIDSFMTGTIPIYWGCPSIDKFFDINGIIQFNTIEELKDIINHLTVDVYNNKINSIRNNFELAKKYLIADDLIYDIIKNGS